MPVGAEEVGWAYRMILGREPSIEEIALHGTAPETDIAGLRRKLLSLDEARRVIDVVEDPEAEYRRRKGRLLEFITREQLGIEIGPWFNPLCPAADGYRCMTADVFDQEQQRQRAGPMNLPPALLDAIAPVDFVGSASELDKLVDEKGLLGQFDYIVSSHNFEHIPNPLRFLQACQRVLRPGGVLSMVLPDCRATGDYFRAPSGTGEMLQAWWEDRTHPSPSQIFAHVAQGAANAGLAEQWRWQVEDRRPAVRLISDLSEGFRIARDHVYGALTEYFDAHCWVFTPTSLRLIMEELRALGLIRFVVQKIDSTGGCEFFVHMMNQADIPAEIGDVGDRRLARLHEINRETGMRT